MGVVVTEPDRLDWMLVDRPRERMSTGATDPVVELAESSACRRSGRMTVKRDPCPTTESALRTPPRLRTIRATTARPRPRPPRRRSSASLATDDSTCSNSRNMLSSLTVGMPTLRLT
jgi:hypothetical protein